MKLAQLDITGGSNIVGEKEKKQSQPAIKKQFKKIIMNDAILEKQADAEAMLVLRMLQKKAMFNNQQNASILRRLLQYEMDIKNGNISQSTAARSAFVLCCKNIL